MTKTLGEIRARTEFNPSNKYHVDQIKQKTAELIDLVGEIPFQECDINSPEPKANIEKDRLIALARTSYEQALMWAVKAATVGDLED